MFSVGPQKLHLSILLFHHSTRFHGRLYYTGLARHCTWKFQIFKC